MKYLLLNEKKSFLIILKYIIIYYICIISFIIFSKFLNLENYEGIVLSADFKLKFPECLIYLMNIVFYILISISIFVSDIKNNVSNVLIRLTKKKYVLYKIFAIFILVLFLKIVTFLIIIFFNGNIFFDNIVNNILFFYVLSSFICYIYISNKRYISIIIVLILCIIFKTFKLLNLASNACNTFVLIILLLIFIFVTIYRSKNIYNIYERCD